jgi:hypothetical protein
MEVSWQEYLIVAFVALIFIWLFSRQKKQGSLKTSLVSSLTSEIKDNLKIIEVRSGNPQSEKVFKIREWTNYQTKVSFLGEENVKNLSEAFKLISDFNVMINQAKKNKNQASLQTLQIEHLKELLVKSQDGLAKWLQENQYRELEGRK